ncbi:FkbM family methyltransferase [Bradyrhizobium japonicum]|uniref:FkbM family methyltransferase n=1 Tax=Bradyrhizobium japonicum TaxID=375 RepID=UPI0005779711|nr:FkbM family methyltransferase [Bradyrhizobium japonicum]
MYGEYDQVSHIYDFGANIGLASLYFSCVYPNAKLTCIEPLPNNIEFLRANLSLNSIDAVILPVAAGRARGSVELFHSPQSHALPSLFTRQANSIEAPMVPFADIVAGESYGLKIDIEGAEADLIDFPEVVLKAKWIVGELHYTGETAHDYKVDELVALISSRFEICRGRPIAYFVGQDVVICESFRARRS